MKTPLSANYYADRAGQYEVVVEDRRLLAEDTFLVRFACPDMAAGITPGQFLMVRPLRGDDPLLGRAFALYDVWLDSEGMPYAIDIVFHVIGKMTRFLSEIRRGDRLIAWGPLGNGFPIQARQHLVMVAGGIGQTPFMALAKESLGLQRFGDRPQGTVGRATLCYGARSGNLLAGVEDFTALGVDVQVATDDGSLGHHGLVTDLLENLIATSGQGMHVVCCGPEPMMEAVGGLCLSHDVPCQLSLETPMACGLGICFSCVTKVAQPDGSWDFKRTCVDGPVFNADELVW